MESKRVGVEELKQALAADFERLARQVAAALNAALDGRIVAGTEELVRQARATFREQRCEKAIRLLPNQQAASSPLGPRGSGTKARSRRRL